MTVFVCSRNYFEFNSKIKHQTSVTKQSKRVPNNNGICMDKFENGFLSLQRDKIFVRIRYIDDVFFCINKWRKTILQIFRELK